MRKVERVVERSLLWSRWLLVIFYAGLGLALAIYAVGFLKKLWKIGTNVLTMADTDLLLAMLGLVDAALVAGLIVMVMIAGYENFVSRFDDAEGARDLSWMGKLDSGGLKLKVATAIVAIASISLLQVFMNLEHYPEWQVRWSCIIYGVFVVAALLLGLLERLPSIWKGGSGH
jgi:uncharacterized protein (TIGR00645 family)